MELKKEITEEIWDQYYNLIYKMCRKYQHINWLFDLDDLLSESYICLKQCYESYDENRGKFSTFLFTSLNNYLYQVVNGTTSKDKGNKLLNCCVSIYQTLSDTDDCTIEDMIEDITAENDFNLPEIMFMADLRAAEEEAINKLSPKQKLVVEALNEFNSAKYSASELANHLSVNTKRIYEIKDDAYMKLRRNKQLRKIWYEEFIRY